MNQPYQSWGRFPQADDQQIVKMEWSHSPVPQTDHTEKTYLPFGYGRSYGDICLNDGGILIDTRPLARFISFDSENGILHCEAGVLFSEILEIIVPQGWFLPVTPGTQFVTVGGAIANDVHGKNHHKSGTFGCHVRSFELLRSDGARLQCSPQKNKDWFSATIGGFGLTGLITTVTFNLKKISSPFIQQEEIRYSNIDNFFQLSEESNEDFEYTVAWVDCLAKGKQLGRGIFFRGNHEKGSGQEKAACSSHNLSIPFDPPCSLINSWTSKCFNTIYYYGHRQKNEPKILHYRPFFYPLDSILQWNRLYGPKGFVQYQCVLPGEKGRDAIKEILHRISRTGIGSFLAVLKIFGNYPSPGIMSFPQPGVTLALDFQYQGKKTFNLLDSLDEVTREALGAVYPAKDAHMTPESFQAYFPQWKQLKPFIDPKFSSRFWRRVIPETL